MSNFSAKRSSNYSKNYTKKLEKQKRTFNATTNAYEDRLNSSCKGSINDNLGSAGRVDEDDIE